MEGKSKCVFLYNVERRGCNIPPRLCLGTEEPVESNSVFWGSQPTLHQSDVNFEEFFSHDINAMQLNLWQTYSPRSLPKPILLLFGISLLRPVTRESNAMLNFTTRNFCFQMHFTFRLLENPIWICIVPLSVIPFKAYNNTLENIECSFMRNN